jgi:hypothetical protein
MKKKLLIVAGVLLDHRCDGVGYLVDGTADEFLKGYGDFGRLFDKSETELAALNRKAGDGPA